MGSGLMFEIKAGVQLNLIAGQNMPLRVMEVIMSKKSLIAVVAAVLAISTIFSPLAPGLT